MEEGKIKDSDIERFREMEDKLLSLGDIKYSRDSEMEGKIRYIILCEKFGEDRVDSFLEENSIKITDLSIKDKYDGFYEILDKLWNS